MSTITVNGKRVVSGSITFPFYGAWSADLVMADPAFDSTDPAVTIVVGDLTIKGTIVRFGSYAGSLSARIVGGAGGWRRTLPPKGYRHLAGVKLSSVLGDAARSCGETIVIDTDRTLGAHWVRDEAKAEALLMLCLDGEWWIDRDGITQTEARDGSPIVTPFTAIGMSGAKGSFEIGSEAIAPWQPGRTFQSSTVPDAQTISSVTIEASNEGKLRLHVLTTNGAIERLRSDVRSIVRAELAALSYAGEWEYTVAPSTGMPGLVTTIDCTPTDDRMPPITGVPVKGIGVVSAPMAGTKCRIRFVNMDPSRPEVCAIESTTEHFITYEAAVLLIYNVLQSLTLANPGPLIGLTLQPVLTPAMLIGLAAQAAPAPPGSIAQISASAAQTAAMTAGTAPSNTVGPFAAAVALLATKTPNVTGLFPSIGVPNG